MKVLVTGAAGFIGSYVSRALILRGDDVIGIDNFNDYYPRKCKEFNLDLINLTANQPIKFAAQNEIEPVFGKMTEYFPTATAELGTFNFFEADIVDYTKLAQIFTDNGIGGVTHLAAMAGVPLSTKNPKLYTEVNVDGTVNLLELCAKNGVTKFVFGSSSSVYGNREDKKVTENDDVSRAVSVYGASKVAGEVLTHAFTAIYGLNAVVARIFGPIYGPLQRPYGMLHQRAINYVHNGKTLQIYGKNGLKTAKDSTYIDDEVSGLINCLDYDTGFEVFNIGTSTPLPIETWLDAVEKAYGKAVKYELIDTDKADVVSSADISKARKLLDYEPEFDMYEGVKRQVEVFKLMPEWYQNMDNI